MQAIVSLALGRLATRAPPVLRDDRGIGNALERKGKRLLRLSGLWFRLSSLRL